MNSRPEPALSNALDPADHGQPDGQHITVQALLDQLQQQAAETLRLNAILAKRDASLLHAEAKIQALTFELAQLRRIRFGAKSEALNTEQRDLFQETLETDIAACEAETEQVVPEIKTTARRQRAGRQPLPESLPRIEVRHEPESCACGKCGKDMVMIREDVSEQLDVKPAEFFVIRNIRPQYACRVCDTVSAATIPAAIIDGGLAAPGLLTWVVIGKYADHLPLYRLEQIAARQGIILASSTLADWIGRIGVALITELGCLAHARRKFFDLYAANQSPVAKEALDRIGKLYAIEQAGRDLDIGARQTLRRNEAQPLLTELFEWLFAMRRKTADGSALAKAIDYSLKSG
jgi:transposase